MQRSSDGGGDERRTGAAGDRSRGGRGSKGPMPTPHSGSSKPVLPAISADPHVVTLETNDGQPTQVAALSEPTMSQQSLAAELEREDTPFNELVHDVAAVAGDGDDAITSSMERALKAAACSQTDGSSAESAADRADLPLEPAPHAQPDPSPPAVPRAARTPKLVHAQPSASKHAAAPQVGHGHATRATAAAQRKQSKVGTLTPSGTAVSTRARKAAAKAAAALDNNPNG